MLIFIPIHIAWARENAPEDILDAIISLRRVQTCIRRDRAACTEAIGRTSLDFRINFVPEQFKIRRQER